jgi:hypothetical protein
MSVAVLALSLLLDTNCADMTKARDATRMIRSRTPTIETDLDIFGIIDIPT